MKRLHQYLYGRSFTLRTDHKPLLKIFGGKDGLPSVSVARLQKWAVILSSYDYTIQHISGNNNVIADCLSRLPVPLSAAQEEKIAKSICGVQCDPCQDMPISSAMVAKESARDPTISKVLQHVCNGWPSSVSDE